MAIFKKEVKMPVETTQFVAPNPDVYHRILNLAIDYWLKKGNTFNFTAQGKNLKHIESLFFDDEDIKKAIVEYVLTHEQEFKEIMADGIETEALPIKGIIYRKGGNYIFKQK